MGLIWKIRKAGVELGFFLLDFLIATSCRWVLAETLKSKTVITMTKHWFASSSHCFGFDAHLTPRSREPVSLVAPCQIAAKLDGYPDLEPGWGVGMERWVGGGRGGYTDH